MDIFIEIIGWAAGIVGMIAGVPQTYKIIKTKEVAGLSLGTFICFFCSVLLWGIYGLLLKIYPMMFFNTIALILYLIVIFMIIKYKK